MAFLQWRKFYFFDKEIVKDSETNQSYEKLKELQIICSTSGRGQIVLGDQSGYVHFLNRHFQLSSFKAYTVSVSLLYQLRQDPILVTVGLDEPGVKSTIKVWKLENMDKPSCIRVVQPAAGSKEVTCVCVHESMTLMAVGHDDGSLMLIRGDITRERQSKQRSLQLGTQPITALGFRTSTDGKQMHLFVTTVKKVFSINVNVKDKEVELELDEHGCPAHCAVVSDAKQDHHFVVARREAIYFYQPDSRGPCLVFEGEKSIAHWFKGYLVIVGKNEKSQASAVGTSQLEMDIVTVYDIQNKFIAYSVPIASVQEVISEWGTLYILSKDGKLYNLQEKDTQSKLEMLFRKNQYSLAISLAKSQNYDEEGLADIFRQYGDHLYSKGDHDGAITQYSKTIGNLEASYVIRKFLDAQRIHNLTAYLQALHKRGLATEDHTTLLLNCYTKLKDNSKLDEFIMTKDREVDFDVEIAIKVCRQAGYYSHALYLAEKHGQHNWYLRIQLEDQKDYIKALEYIGKLDFNQAENNMKNYGKVLINAVPEETTAFLKQLCTDYRPNNAPLVNEKMLTGSPPPAIQKSRAEEFIHIFVNNCTKLTEFLEHMIKVTAEAASLLYNTLLELYLQAYKHETDPKVKNSLEQKIMDMLRNPEARYDIDQAMILSQMNSFKPGVLHLYERAKLYQQILSYYMEHYDNENVIKTCERFGSADPNLWVQALWFFSNSGENHKTELLRVMRKIEENKLLPPIMVVDIISQSPTATLGVIKDYLIRHLQQQTEQMNEDERLMKSYREETEKMKSHIEELRTSAKIFQVSKCSGCNYQLELPSVHFLCGHSYHQQCFESYSAESDSECPLCLPENRKVLDIIRAQEQNRDLHEQFHHQLERAEDGFTVVSDYFSRGVFNKVTIITDPVSRSVPNIPAPLQRNLLLS